MSVPGGLKIKVQFCQIDILYIHAQKLSNTTCKQTEPQGNIFNGKICYRVSGPFRHIFFGRCDNFITFCEEHRTFYVTKDSGFDAKAMNIYIQIIFCVQCNFVPA